MKHTKRRILMDLKVLKQVAHLASAGLGNKAIMRRMKDHGLSDGQISYRCHSYKEGVGLDEGLRVRWRNGNHPAVDMILNDIQGIQDYEFDRKFLPNLAHPTPEIVRLKERKAPTIDEAVRQLKRRKVGLP